MDKNLPIGVFDSGIGGLTVLESLASMLPNEDFIYLADSSYCPYGTKTKDEIEKRVMMIGKSLENKVKAIVIACNTATTSSSEYQSRALVKVIGVIVPTVEEAIKVSCNKKFLLLATNLTVDSKTYQKLLKDKDCEVVECRASKLVSLAESNDRDSLNTQKEVSLLLEQYKNDDFDTIIYGCTHFGLLDKSIKNALGNRFSVDSGLPTAKVLKQYLEENDLINNNKKIQEITIYTTKDPEELKTQIIWFNKKYLGPYIWRMI